MAGILNGNNSGVIYMQLTAFLWKLEDRKQSLDSNNAAFTEKKKKKILKSLRRKGRLDIESCRAMWKVNSFPTWEITENSSPPHLSDEM